MEQCAEGRNVAKGTAMVVLFTLSFLIGSTPIKLSKIYKWNTHSKNNNYVRTLLGIGGGVLMCTTFIHLLPEVAENFEDLNLTPNLDIPYAELLMCIGFFAMYFVEECVHVYLHLQEDLTVLRRSLSIKRGEFEIDIRKEIEEHVTGHEGHSHITVNQSVNDSTTKAIRGLLVVLALSIHELFEGLAVGLESSSSTVWYMFGAVSAHKLVIAFCIGVELVTSGISTRLVIIYVFTFAIVSPLGIGTGMLVTNINHTSTDLIAVILQGLASGTLLYVVFFEILQSDKKAGIRQFFAVLAGFSIMLGITLFE